MVKTTPKYLFGGFLLFGFLLFGLLYVVTSNTLISHDDSSPLNTEKINVVLTFPFMYDTSTRRAYPNLSYQDLDRRMEEFIASLQTTLLHDRVGSVHVLYDNDMLPSYIKDNIFSGSFKLKFFKIINARKVSDIFRYVFDHLQHQLVMVNQADTYPEKGFHLINKSKLSDNRLLYALTRHGRLEDSCIMSGEFCDRKLYVGSHDAYVFVPSGTFTREASTYLSTRSTSWGIDLLIVWVFENILRYRVLNPCKVIYIYHRHCSSIRDVNRGRINTRNTTGWSPPTDKLI